jgi:hypothetical protein
VAGSLHGAVVQQGLRRSGAGARRWGLEWSGDAMQVGVEWADMGLMERRGSWQGGRRLRCWAEASEELEVGGRRASSGARQSKERRMLCCRRGPALAGGPAKAGPHTGSDFFEKFCASCSSI